MKCSELIAHLQAVIATRGDLDVYTEADFLLETDEPPRVLERLPEHCEWQGGDDVDGFKPPLVVI